MNLLYYIITLTPKTTCTRQSAKLLNWRKHTTKRLVKPLFYLFVDAILAVMINHWPWKVTAHAVCTTAASNFTFKLYAALQCKIIYNNRWRSHCILWYCCLRACKLALQSISIPIYPNILALTFTITLTVTRVHEYFSPYKLMFFDHEPLFKYSVFVFLRRPTGQQHLKTVSVLIPIIPQTKSSLLCIYLLYVARIFKC